MKKAKEKPHYVDNKKFLEAMIEHRDKCERAKNKNRKKPEVTNYIGECFLKIANHLSYRPNFINYTFRDDMISDGIENCLQYMDKLINKAPNDLTDYRIVKLSDGSTLVGSISLDKEFLRIQNPLQLITTPRMTEVGVKEDNTLAPWIPFTNDKMFVIPKEKVMVISRAAKELANYYDVILTKLQQTKVKAVYSAEEINKIMEIADKLEKELRDGEEDDNVLYNETTKTVH